MSPNPASDAAAAARGGAMHRELNREKTMQSRVPSKTYGTVAANTQKEMSGLEFVQGLAAGTLPLNTIAETWVMMSPRQSGRVIVTAEPKDIHLNLAGLCMAGSLQPQCRRQLHGLAIQSTLKGGCRFHDP